MRKVWIKDIAKMHELEYLKNLCFSVAGVTNNVYDLMKIHMAEHIMEYKLFLYKLNKRLQNEQN